MVGVKRMQQAFQMRPQELVIDGTKEKVKVFQGKQSMYWACWHIL
jgi:hypothetical protein